MKAKALQPGHVFLHHGVAHTVLSVREAGAEIAIRCETKSGFPVTLYRDAGARVELAPQHMPDNPCTDETLTDNLPVEGRGAWALGHMLWIAWGALAGYGWIVSKVQPLLSP